MSNQAKHRHTSPAIERFELGPYGTNCYIVYEKHQSPASSERNGTGEQVTASNGAEGSAGTGPGGGPEAAGGTGGGCWIVDASFAPSPLIERVRELSLTPELIYLTHTHVDHIAGLGEIRNAFPGVPVALHPDEHPFLADPERNLSLNFGQPMSFADAERTVEHDDTLKLGSLSFRVLHLPGHSPGSTALVWHAHDNTHAEAIVGDALFAGSIGRTDFPTSDHDALISAIQSHLYTLPDTTRVWPGHGPPTTIGKEATTNPFVRRPV